MLDRLRASLSTVTARLAIGYGALMAGSLVLISVMFYFGTIGVLSRSVDGKLRAMSNRLATHFAQQGADDLRLEIQRVLEDGIDSDTEVYLLETPDGRKLAGNLSSWPKASTPFNRLSEQEVVRSGRPSVSRLLPIKLGNGDILVVGRDMQDQREIERLVWRSLETGGVLALQLAIGGAFLFRRQVERRIATIRLTAHRIEAGDLGLRIPVVGAEDEFSRLTHDINRMLDRIQLLMDGVTHVSNAIAHDLRTPLGRVRGQLEQALRSGATEGGSLVTAANSAIGEIDALIAVFDKLLYIAEAESGARRRSFAPFRLGPMLTDVVELYDAMAEDKGMTLASAIDQDLIAWGDKDLLARAVANLVDNALKYAGRGASVRLLASDDGDRLSITVADDGPGIPEDQRSAVLQRFYRLDGSRSYPGNGLGLSLVTAVVSLHGGCFALDDAGPGLVACIVLPHAPAESFQTVS